MKKLYQEQEIPLYKIQKDLGLSSSRLYRYADKTTKIESMPITLVLDLAYYFKMNPNELFKKMKQYCE